MEHHDPAARAVALQKIGPPAIGVAVVAGIDGLLCVASLLWHLLQVAGTPLIDASGEGRAWWFLSGVGGVAWALFGLAIAGFVLWAALRMRALASYPLAVAACAISLVPCLTPCCILGLPFGIWGLIVMHDRAVRPFFES